MSFELDDKELRNGTLKYFQKVMAEKKRAMEKVGLQLVNNIVNGSPKSNVTPPILTGFLRGSWSVFFEKSFVQGGKDNTVTSYNAGDDTVAVAFNTPYASRWHENAFVPGPVSQQAGNVGDHYISKHLQADGEELTAFFAQLIKRATG